MPVWSAAAATRPAIRSPLTAAAKMLSIVAVWRIDIVLLVVRP
jgi:hypothetical protein